jgi:SWI/SNF-related matrix-associated actin-dependent regulator 1 of chromatin subfamily A
MNVFKAQWPLIIFCPSSLKYSWRDEFMTWVPTLATTDIQLFKTVKDKFSDSACIFIISYDLASRRSEEIEKRNFQAVIADEAHYLKSKDAKRSINLIPIFSQAKRCVLISGTPMLAKPVELYNILRILRPDIFHNFTDFTSRYCAPKPGMYGMDYNGNSCCSELHYLLSENLMIRRLKMDVLTELPSKRRQKIEV